MNWGVKLMIGMLCFMSFIIVLAVKMINSKTDALVDNDYYEKGLAYDKDYNRKEQVKIDGAAPKIEVKNGYVVLTFKDKAVGEAKLIRNSDKRLDRKIMISTDTLNSVKIPAVELEKGRWRLIISWTTDGKAYLDEQEVMVP